ncbi:MAG: PCRF domain-containing protein, partial [Planctomycetes bacterium]|nr:PCRF domain-containing protein [Planctomycetota bacterium]
MKTPEQNNLGPFLEGTLRRYREIEAQIQDPAVLANQAQFTALMKERRRLQPLSDLTVRWKAAEARVAEAEAILADPASDPELRELAKADALEAKAGAEAAMASVTEILLTQEEYADRDVIVEIRAGTGGDEAGLFAGDLFRMYSKYAESRGWKLELLSENSTDLGGYKEVVFSVGGDGVYHA